MAVRMTEEITFGDLIDRGILDITDGYRAQNSELGGNGLIFLRAGHVTDSHIDFTGVERFHDELTPRLKEKISRPGDVAVTTKGNSTGRIAFVKPTMPPFVYSPHMSRWRSLDRDQLEPGFLRYWSSGREFAIQLRGMSASTDMAPYLSLRDQRRLKLTLPPIDNQRAISNALGALDEKIEQNREAAQALEWLARAIFRAWFVDFEPVKAKAAGATAFPSMPQPVFNALPTCFVDSEIGLVPEGWEVKSLSEIATFLNGLALQKYPPRADREDLSVVKIAELRKGSTDGADLANGDVPAEYVIDDRDLLFSWSGTLEAEFWFGGKGALNQHLFKVTSPHFPSWFCLLWIRQHLPWLKAIAASKATTMGHIKRGHLQEAQVVVPPAPVLSQADQVIGSLYDLHAQLMIESRKLVSMRDYLLPKLLSGEVRIHSSLSSGEKKSD
jgi:type I restriction enzyme, S subunit